MIDLLYSQTLIFFAVFIHVIVAGLLSIILDETFPKYSENHNLLRQIMEIAAQLSLGAVIITKLHIISTSLIPGIKSLISSIPFAVVEGVMMIAPMPQLHMKVNHVQSLARNIISLKKF